MPWSSSRPSSDRTKYGAEHRKTRAALIAQLKRDGIGRCCLGGEPLYPEQAALPRTHPRSLAADHCPRCNGRGCLSCGGTGYRGLACRDHNGRDGSKRARDRQTVTARRL